MRYKKRAELEQKYGMPLRAILISIREKHPSASTKEIAAMLNLTPQGLRKLQHKEGLRFKCIVVVEQEAQP